jgi:DNA ligase-1
MLYSRVALALQEICEAGRSVKVERAAALLTEALQEPDLLCPLVRLLIGELWPRWDGREMGIGPEAISAALAEVSDADISMERQKNGDMGLVAEAALEHKGQHPLLSEPLDALSVYEGLRRISELGGTNSDQRKIAVLRGLFLVTSPVEGKFIARTALRSMQTGLGHRGMIASISTALRSDHRALTKAYALMPDLGAIADLARLGRIDGARIRPKVPARFMLFSSGPKIFPGAYLPKYPGLRVQVHKTEDKVLIFTSRMRDITSALEGLSRDIGEIDANFVADADLIGFDNSASAGRRICSQMQMLRYINRRRLTRKSSIRPALLAYDLLALEDEDICILPYAERRARLMSILGQPKALPFSGISTAIEWILTDAGDVDDHLRLAEGALGLLGRDLGSPYIPGEIAEKDFIIRPVQIISALVVGVDLRPEKSLARYQVALRKGEELVPVGMAMRARSEADRLALFQAANSILEEGSGQDGNAPPHILLRLRIMGAKKIGDDLQIIDPVIESFSLDASISDADDLGKLELVSRR